MKTLGLMLGALIFSSCAGMVADYKANTCNYDGAYERGVNDAQAGKALNTPVVTQLCEEKDKPETSRGYREGYMTIKKNPVIQIGTMTKAQKSCEARPGNEAHQSFCENLNSFTCGAHNLCIWQ